jgi:hypothetical protein
MNGFKKAALLILVILTLALPHIATASYQFSNYDFVRNPNRVDNVMRIEMTGRPALRSYRFVGRVGGVNFEGVINLSNYEIDLDYDSSLADGRRATVTLNGTKYTLPLYDWELKPIVNYANTKHTAVVSIFGEGPDNTNYYYIDYHPAFLDTHLGMRLVQSDIILMDPMTFSEAPTSGNKPVYFPGESRQISADQRMILALKISALLNEKYQAWVLTDTDVDYGLTDNGGVLQVTTTPYFYFWKSDISDHERMLSEYNKLRSKVMVLAPKYQQLLAEYENGNQSVVSELNQLQTKLEPDFNRLETLSNALENYEPKVLEVNTLTERVRTNYSNLVGLAPFVFEAVNKTAQYSAFFRGAKKSNLQDWTDFRNEVIRSINLPFVETPNQFAK